MFQSQLHLHPEFHDPKVIRIGNHPPWVILPKVDPRKATSITRNGIVTAKAAASDQPYICRMTKNSSTVVTTMVMAIDPRTAKG
jgi:hypothetical protein